MKFYLSFIIHSPWLSHALAIVFEQAEPVVRVSMGKYPDLGYILYQTEFEFVSPCELLNFTMQEKERSKFKFDLNARKRIEHLCEEEYSNFLLPALDKLAKCEDQQNSYTRSQSRFKRWVVWLLPIVGVILVVAVVAAVVAPIVHLYSKVNANAEELAKAKEQMYNLL